MRLEMLCVVCVFILFKKKKSQLISTEIEIKIKHFVLSNRTIIKSLKIQREKIKLIMLNKIKGISLNKHN